MTNYQPPEGIDFDRLPSDMGKGPRIEIPAALLRTYMTSGSACGAAQMALEAIVADAIDPPKPEPVVTDEMVEAALEAFHEVYDDASWPDGYTDSYVRNKRKSMRAAIEAVECGWTPPGEGSESQSYLLSEISRVRLALKVHGIEGGDLGGEVHNLALDNRYVRERLAMAEGLLRKAASLEDPPYLALGRHQMTTNEVAYLRSLDGEDNTDA